MCVAGSLVRKNVDSLTEEEELRLQSYLRQLEDDLSDAGFQASLKDPKFLDVYVTLSQVLPPPPSYTRTHTHTHTHARTHARTHAHAHAQTQARARTYVHARTHTRTHAHTHTHTFFLQSTFRLDNHAEYTEKRICSIFVKNVYLGQEH